MDKETLNQITDLRNEIDDLKDRIEKLKDNQKVVVDSVKGSSSTYPYIQHNCVIEGIEYPKNKNEKKKYKRQLKSKEDKLDKLINQLEYELNYVADSEIRQIIRYRYEDNMSWVQIMFKMNYNNEDNARKKLERFLKNL